MFDLEFVTPDFAATTIAVEAKTEAGKAFLASMFGAGAVGIELPKSKGEDFYRFATQKGMNVN